MDFPKTEEGFSHYLAREKSQWKTYSQTEKYNAWQNICDFHKKIYDRTPTPYDALNWGLIV